MSTSPAAQVMLWFWKCLLASQYVQEAAQTVLCDLGYVIWSLWTSVRHPQEREYGNSLSEMFVGFKGSLIRQLIRGANGVDFLSCPFFTIWTYFSDACQCPRWSFSTQGIPIYPSSWSSNVWHCQVAPTFSAELMAPGLGSQTLYHLTCWAFRHCAVIICLYTLLLH